MVSVVSVLEKEAILLLAKEEARSGHPAVRYDVLDQK
jgi:hypothetical protein